MPVDNSRAPGFFKLPMSERRAKVSALTGIDQCDLAAAFDAGGLELTTADQMVENALGVFGLPIGAALNFRVNSVDYLVPMVTEEPSVIAAASHAAKRFRAAGGVTASADASLMAAQIAVHDVPDMDAATTALRGASAELLARANVLLAGVVSRGGGATEIEVHDRGEGLLVVHVIVDVCDAMGANMLNTVAEEIGPQVALLAHGRLGLRIVSNYCDRRCARASVSMPFDTVDDDGEVVSRAIVDASIFAERDRYRAVTHNKGVMNGIDAVVVATGNDWRAVEAAAHAWAARAGSYQPIATWRIEDGALHGNVELPLPLGTVGGALRLHRGARLALDMLRVGGVRELACVIAAVGLASNFAALRALAAEGIQRGHMALHNRTKGSQP
jgi:hydroxymethylglutaryl-CoA reductase